MCWNLHPRAGGLVIEVGNDKNEFLVFLAEESKLTMLVHALIVVHIHDVEELSLADGFLRVADIQHFGVELLQILFFLGE